MRGRLSVCGCVEVTLRAKENYFAIGIYRHAVAGDENDAAVVTVTTLSVPMKTKMHIKSVGKIKQLLLTQNLFVPIKRIQKHPFFCFISTSSRFCFRFFFFICFISSGLCVSKLLLIHLKCNTSRVVCAFRSPSLFLFFAVSAVFRYTTLFSHFFEFHFFAFSVYYHDFYANQQNIMIQKRQLIIINNNNVKISTQYKINS